MADTYQLVPVDHDPFGGGHLPDWYGQETVPDVSPLERYRFSGAPEAVNRTSPDYGTVARGQRQGGHYSDMTDDQRDAYAHGFAHASGLVASFVNPVMGAGMMGGEALNRGEPAEAAGEAVSAAVPYGLARFPKTGAAALASYFTAGQSTATGGGLIDSLPLEERAAYADRLKQAGKIDSPKRRDAEIGKINAEITAKVSSRAEAERSLANNKQADIDWLNATHDMRVSLKPEQQSQITAAANLPERQALFSRFMQQREEAGKTFAEKHGPELEAIRAGSAALGVALPMYQRLRQVGALERATGDAEKAWAAASTTRPTKATKADLAMRTNILRDTANIPSGAAEFAKELGYGSLLPYTTATFIPNALEATGRFATGTPEDRAVGYRALQNMIDPGAVGASLGEGALATLGGQFLGRGLKNAPVAESRARGVLSTLTAEADAKAAAAAKAAATRAANKKAQQAGALSGGSAGALTAPAAAPPKRRPPKSKPDSSP